MGCYWLHYVGLGSAYSVLYSSDEGFPLSQKSFPKSNLLLSTLFRSTPDESSGSSLTTSRSWAAHMMIPSSLGTSSTATANTRSPVDPTHPNQPGDHTGGHLSVLYRTLQGCISTQSICVKNYWLWIECLLKWTPWMPFPRVSISHGLHSIQRPLIHRKWAPYVVYCTIHVHPCLWIILPSHD